MFDKNNRYITRGVEADIPLELQLFMWSNIDKLKEQGEILDHLQIFELTEKRADDIFYQNIEHRQQEPESKRTYKLLVKETVNAKIFVIDNGTYVTIMLAEEY